MLKRLRIHSLIVGVLGLFLVAGCGNADYSRTQDGLIYKIFKTGDGPLIKPKTYLKLNQSASIRDSVLFSTYSFLPAYGFFDSLPTPAHDFLDILDKMRVGDSAVILRSVDTIYNRGGIQYNETFKKGDNIQVVIKVLGSFDTEEAMNADREKSFNAFKQVEIERLKEYISSKNLTPQETKEGVFVVIEKEGTGPKVDSGMYVRVNYTGSLKNGNVFDSNVDSSFGHTEPFQYMAGARQVIPGWDIGVMQLKQGSKAKIFIPSLLGYGRESQGDKLPAFSDLIFEIEVLEVKANE
jgi:FKBP-type peptidyl-prolyl cis-trans isomerase